MPKKPSYKVRQENRGSELSDYWPLFSLIAITAAAAFAVIWPMDAGIMAWMHYFMGFFLCCFAMLKIFNLPAFADGFQMYDLIAKNNRQYAYAYPFIELALGLSYLSFTFPLATYTLTIVVMGIGTIGVFQALSKGLDIDCPCMGSVLNVPLSTVTLTEDIGMATMAAIMIAFSI